jgi:DhnA family fructose-bisphosphate aldolase class Ia
MPVVAEMMPTAENAYDGQAVAHAARIGFELGADIIKTNYCGDVEAFRRVVASSPVPILTAGGPHKGSGEESTLQLVREVVAAGAAGVAIGRRVWQSDDPEGLVRMMHGILFPSETGS